MTDNHNDNTKETATSSIEELINQSVPVIDLGPLIETIVGGDNNNNNGYNDNVDYYNVTVLQPIIEQIAYACSTYGFFQVIHHGISDDIITEFRQQLYNYFMNVPIEVKKQYYKRNENNSRGFFDDELTKQKLDWKQCLDIGIPNSRNWNIPDIDPRNYCLDGYNQFPEDSVVPNFRTTVTTYFDECSKLSHILASLMAKGIDPDYELRNLSSLVTSSNNGDDDDIDIVDTTIIGELHRNHTSYLRMNYYPVCPTDTENTENTNTDDHPLGISPHRDAGFLTVLLQDDDCHSLQVNYNKEWITIHPIPGAVTINTGDMAQLWSNGKYIAPLHRVLTDPTKIRFSAPYFYNPPYTTYVQPTPASLQIQIVPSSLKDEKFSDEHKETASDGDGTTTVGVCKYHPVLWGYFRAVRFAGDLTDLGVEIQIDDFEISKVESSPHLRRQKEFVQVVNFQQPFSVKQFRTLLTS